MSLLDEIYSELKQQERAGNHLIGSTSFAHLDPSKEVQGPLVRGAQIFPRIKQLIENAEQEVLISLYKFQADSAGGKEIIAALVNLKKKAENTGRKISVKIIINKKSGLASVVSGDGRQSPLENRLAELQSSSFFDFQLAYHRHQLFDSTHSKMFIADNQKVALLTGDPTFKNAKSQESWVEVGTVCENQAIASGARKQFATLWNNPKVVPVPHHTKKMLVHQDQPREDNQGNKTILFLGKTASKNPFINKNSPYKIALLKLLHAAKHSVQVMVNNINDRDIIAALHECAHRGVKVELVTGRYHGESAEKLPLAGGTNLESLNNLMHLASSKAKKNLQVRWACNMQGHLVQNMGVDTIHAKAVIIDSEYVLTGSSLMDRQSLRSGESDILFHSQTLAQQYQQQAFQPAFNKGRPFTTTKPATRNLIRERLKNAKTIEEIKTLLSMYILVREYEDRFHGIGLFQRSRNDRANKIANAQLTLNSLNPNKQNQKYLRSNDGLLGEIHKKLSIIEKNTAELHPQQTKTKRMRN